MSANCSGTANGNVVTDSGSKGWNKNGKNRTALDTATFDYNWDLVADKNTDKSSLTKQDKFTNVKGAKGLSHHGDKSWPTTVRNLIGTVGSTAYARLMGQATVYPGDWWNHWMVSSSLLVRSNPVADGGKAYATASITDPWKISYRGAVGAKERNLLMCTVHFGGSIAAGHGGVGLEGTMGRLGIALGPTGAFTPYARLKAGWKAYLNVHFSNRRKHRAIPREASAADIERALARGFSKSSGTWKTGRKRLHVTFTKDLGRQGGKATLKVGFSASHRR